MKRRHLSEIYNEFTFPLRNMESVKLSDEDLNVEQLPQFLRRMKVNQISWKYNAKIVGVDGSYVETTGDGEKVIVRTPITIMSIPWSFPKIKAEAIKNLAIDLLPCTEGEGVINPSPWERRMDYLIGPGEFTSQPKRGLKRDILTSDKVLSTGFFNPIFIF
ncbi:hypothetical protein CM19_05410 [Candidatus Acidianus copahuensis]|uniref:Uncharacterized protein n=1 Tax=Candidatus Acidianus copahuensis TaxID=1160895 RepID=A0A031LN73_9CREN|nr:hypothetical protein CM19_05410 [Candidatus Acidianus copahuensis]